MQFKHPEILYALFALLIPILVHLFQLRRFKKVPFTNVAFLKAVTMQTRKSSQIKKWLTLLARLLALAALIIAFAQPFFASKEALVAEKELVVYLDNSFSMEAKGAKGPLFKRAVQELLSSISEGERLSVFTNDKVYKNTSLNDLKEELLRLDYSSTQLSYEAAFLKAKQLFSKSESSSKRAILVSDFQQHTGALKIKTDGAIKLDLVQVTPMSRENIAVDSLYLDKDISEKLALKVQLYNYGTTKKELAVSLYDATALIAKTSVELEANSKKEASFILPENKTIKGEVRIDDPHINYDNTRFFSVNIPEKIGVLVVNGGDDRFLKNIFTEEEFLLKTFKPENLDYNAIAGSNLIILNEVATLPVPLINSLTAFAAEGGLVCLIPATNGVTQSYQQLYGAFGTGTWKALQKQEKQITTIHFSHPIFKGVFDKTVNNFQYPSVQSLFPLSGSSPLLSFEDNRPFLVQNGNLFAFAAALNAENSNFKNSPLIVPTLYNIGKQSLQYSELYGTIGQNNTYEIPATLGADEILTLVSETESSIPQQQSFSNKVVITTTDVPETAGIYTIKQKETPLHFVAYNYGSEESRLLYHDVSTIEGVTVTKDLNTVLADIKVNQEIQLMWKWFIIFAVLFLAIEMLLLKFLK